MIVPRLLRPLLVACLLVIAVQPVRARSLAPISNPTFALIGEPTPSGADPLIKLINQARISILVETYALNDPAVAHALSAARSRGVDVRVMTDPHSASSGTILASLAGVDVWTRRGNPAFSLTGQTAVILDRTTLAISNAPLTVTARTTQRRFLMIDIDLKDVMQASSVFYDDWERRTPNRFGDNTVLGPPDYETDVISAINSSSRSLNIMAEALSSQAVTQAITGAALRKVRVRVLFDPGVPSPIIQQLQLAGVVVRLLSTGFAGTAIAVDDSRLMLGSAPMTDAALQQQRHLGLLVKNGDVSNTFMTIFDNDWGGAAAIAVPTSTPIPTNTPTAKPTPKGRHHSTPTPARPTATPVRAHATPTPTLPVRTGPISVNASYGSSVRIGSQQQIIIRTSPLARVSIIITYPDGATTNAGTRTGSADASGAFTDSWSISLTTVPGTAKVLITATSGGHSKTVAGTFRITF
ncbi:MAG: cardiolipin synthase [Chloroflexi bacterium]|nr:cardiolipin synthase [Chloroflexota bacterium]